MIKLAAFDIDGTLFDERHRKFPASSVEALSLLKKAHILIAVTTGRPPLTASVLRAEGIFPDYYVCSNGHLVLNGEGTILLDEGFPAELAEDVWNYCQEREIALLWKYPDCIYVYSSNEELDKILAKNPMSNTAKPLTIHFNDRTVHHIRRPNGGCLACSVEELARFNETFVGRCRGVDINGRSSDLLRWDVNKQTGFARLLSIIGVKPEECIAFGDNRNDLEILRYAGIGVAMGNGEDELKANSDYVTTAVDADGIYLALKHFQLIK